MDQRIEKLLHIPKILRDKYQRDASFNLFKVLRSSSDEVRLHSRFLAELLDPKGSHNLNNIFLMQFIQGTLNLHEFDVDTAFVQKEWNDIDILIRNQNGQAIIIENKIYANDQDNQLNRYFNIVNDLNYKEENIHVVYLTLDGKTASTQSLKGIPTKIIDDNYYKISYKIDIPSWLCNCKKEAVDNPELRESIAQYISLISELTHTNQNALFMKELESWFEKELFNGQPVELLDALNVAKENFHAKRINYLREMIISKLTDIDMNTKDSAASLADCTDFVIGNGSFDLWFYPFKDVKKLQIGFICNHGTSYISVWCSQKGDQEVYNCARAAISNLVGQYKANQWDAGWKYISDPILLSESTDKNLRKLADDHYLASLAESIASEVRVIYEVFKKDRALNSLF